MEEREAIPIREELFQFPLPSDGKGTLYGGRCKLCGHQFFPKNLFCPLCNGEKVERIPLSQRGTLYSFTVVLVSSKGLH